MRFTYPQYVAVFRALSDETRIKIVELLCQQEMCTCQMLKHFAITQPTLSYHIKILSESGLITSRREGAWTMYRIDPEKASMVRCFLEDVNPQTKETLFG